MKKLIIILFGLIGVVYGQTVKVSPGINVLAASDTVNRYIRPIAGTNMTITGIFPNLTFSSTASGGSVNLTGPITSVGAATSIALQTGTGSTFVMNTSPTLITPNIGTATGLSLTMSGNISTNAWTTSGVRLKGIPATFTDLTSSGTVPAAYTDVLGGNTISATNATTFSNYTTAFFKDPIIGTNVTMTNKYALGSESAIFGTSNQVTVTNAGILTATNSVLASPALTGVPTSPTATGGTNTTQIATTAFVTAAVSGAGLTSANFIFNEQFTGSATSSYTLANTPVTGKLSVFKNGMLSTDYTLTGAVVTLGSARLVTDIFTNNYIK